MIRWDVVKDCLKDSYTILEPVIIMAGIILYLIILCFFWGWVMPVYGWIPALISFVLSFFLLGMGICYKRKIKNLQYLDPKNWADYQ